MATKFGSLWRRWDLHLHTPATKLSSAYTGANDDEVWNRYIDTLEASPVEAFGITDYFSCESYFVLLDKYQKKYPETSKVFFPNIEFRLSDAISAGGDNPHLHVLFDYDPQVCPKTKLEAFLSNLKTKGEDGDGARVPCSSLKSKRDFEAASVSFDEVRQSLSEVFGQNSLAYLIAFPAKNDGVRSTDRSSPRKILITEKIDRYSDLLFGSRDSSEFFLKPDRYSEGVSRAKPVVSGSDAHSFEDLERLDGNVAAYPSTWIKADLTFRGLRQICFEPEARVYIGMEPEVETRKQSQSTKFLSSLKIGQVAGYSESNGRWFKGVEIPLNPELTAIIGNKGSGKSAIVDILGLLGNSRQEEYFSFLSATPGNKKFRQRGYAENFVATAEWLSGDITQKLLSDRCDASKPEAVRYLPQNYFEQLTNEIEIESFRREIEEVVFSHVDETEKLGKSSFSELEQFKTLTSKQETSALKTRLRELNLEIVELEEKSDPKFRKALEEELTSKQAELRALDKAEPAEPPKPGIQSEEQKALAAEVERLSEWLQVIANAEQVAIDTLGRKKANLQRIVSLAHSISALANDITLKKLELKSACAELGVDVHEIIHMEIDTTPLEEKKEVAQREIAAAQIDNNFEIDPSKNPVIPTTIPDLQAAQAQLKEKIEETRELLGAPQRKYQAYLDKKRVWTAQRNTILGSAGAAEPGTIRALQQQLAFIDGELSEDITSRRAKRREIVESIYKSKKQILDFYADLKESVEAQLRSVRTTEFSISIDASFLPGRTFLTTLMRHVNHRRKGTYKDSEQAERMLSERMNEVKWNDFESTYKFLESVLHDLNFFEGEPISIREQVSDIKELYDFIFSLEYISAKYELRLGEKNLDELSPGEKGLLLLIFYLQLDLENVPLIIDQPEDNLDNESIFAVLARCIREAKKRRQVILVTHNPNLAVGADAEQVVCVKLDKPANYKFSYESGAIESPRINQRIVDILEGSQPAFVQRRLKYQIN